MISRRKVIEIARHDSMQQELSGRNTDLLGNGGLLFPNTVLGEDKSVTDKLVVEGDTSGKTSVSMTNAGGTGAETLNDIEIIRVGGASDGEFTQAGRIFAGAYDYTSGQRPG